MTVGELKEKLKDFNDDILVVFNDYDYGEIEVSILKVEEGKLILNGE